MSTTTQSITPSQNTVSYSTMNTDMQNLFGQSFTNRIINGAMVIDQRNNGASVTVTTSTGYTLDRWTTAVDASSKFSVQQVSDAPAGFKNSLKVTSLSAYTPSSSEEFRVGTIVEGYNWADMGYGASGASTAVLSFQVKSSLTGTFGLYIANADNSRTFVSTYVVNAANTWETKTVTITGDTTGTWLSTNGRGIQVFFMLSAGSNYYTATTNSWTSSSGVRTTSGQTQLVSTNGATLQVTGVQLEKGSTATSFDYRPYGTELSLCQRYFTNFTVSGGYTYIAQAYSATAARTQAIPFKVSMRATPTITLGTAGTSSGQSAFLQANNSNPSGVGSHAAVSITTEQFLINSSGYSGTSWSAGTATSFYAEGSQTVWASSAEL
jgi:hypothetical protein